MLQIIHTSRFEKEVAKVKKQGKDFSKLKSIITLLANNKPLPPKNKNHKLKGEYNGYWEYHIEPDWLLIYNRTATELILIRTGSHSNLFP